jgi:hypothetical protein
MLNKYEREIINKLAEKHTKEDNFDRVSKRMQEIMSYCKDNNIYPDIKKYWKEENILKTNVEQLYIGDIIILKKWEQLFSYYCGEARQLYNTKHKFTSKYQDKDFDYNKMMHINGFSGELAVCKYLGVCPVFSPVLKSAAVGKDEGDCQFRGLNIDVKTTLKSTNALLEVEDRKMDNDIDGYVLVNRNYTTGTDVSKRFKILGWCSKDYVLKDHDSVRNDTRYGNRTKKVFIVEKNRLMDFDEMYEIILENQESPQ